MSTTNNNGLPSGTVTPQEIARITAAVKSKEQAPSSRTQAALFGDYAKARDQLGSPFEVGKIPLSKLDAMRRDPMLGFGLSFIKTPHVRAKWYINAKSNAGPNAQIAAHLDHDLRRIYPSLVNQMLVSLDYGFTAIAKRFELRVPAATYIETSDSGEQTEQPVWTTTGVEPVAWKPFVPMYPGNVEPIWSNTGEFDGIKFTPPEGAGESGSGGGGGATNDKGVVIDLDHSLWFTLEKDANFGSIYGYPRLGYAYRYWWSYWFRWAVADRAFERKADPSVIVKHPSGGEIDEITGEQFNYNEYALSIGERMRSGGVFAMPSEVYEDSNGRGTTPMWDISFTKDATDFEPFDKSFEYLDVQKIRALAIPEQAFMEGSGGTSSRNVAAEMASSFIESQAVLSQQIVEHINRFVIPQWVAINYPEFIADGGKAEMVMQGFADEDTAFSTQLVTLIGQQETGAAEIAKIVDLERILDARGTPIAPFEVQQRRQAEIDAAAAAAAAPAVEGVPGESVGVVEDGLSGFSQYVNPREVINLSNNSAADFIASLPDAHQYSDAKIQKEMRKMRNLFRIIYMDDYESLIAAFDEGSDDLGIELADGNFTDRAKDFLRRARNSRSWPAALRETKNYLGNMMRRASEVELKRANLDAKLPTDAIETVVAERMAEVIDGIAETNRNEVAQFVAKRIEEGTVSRKEIVDEARKHFDSFPAWKADRLVRTETREIYNRATIEAARKAGVNALQATDGDGDEYCQNRDGQIFTLDQAAKETEHPNGLLGWKIVPAENLSIEVYANDDFMMELAAYDPETQTVKMSADLTIHERNDYLKSLVGEIIENA